MKLSKTECPGCGAVVNAAPGQKYCLCEYCGTRISIQYAPGEQPQEVIYRDVARLRELELQEEARVREEQRRLERREKEQLLKTISVLGSDEATTALKSIGKLAARFLKNNL